MRHAQVPNPSVASQRRVIVFRSSLLQYSETFIKEQVVACKRWRPVLVGRNRVAGISLDGVPSRVLHPSTPGYLTRKVQKALREVDLPPPGLVGLMKRENPSVVHVHFGTDAVDYWPALSRVKVPVLVTLHGYDINTAKSVWRSRGIADRQYPDRLVSIAHRPGIHFLAVSEAIRDRAIAFGIPPQRIAVRYIGVDTSRFTPSGDPVARRQPRVLFVGRLVEKKGVSVLLEAFAQVLPSVRGAELVLVGDGPLRDDLQRQAAALGFRALFKGRMSSEAVRSEMHASRVLCLPSITAADGDAEGLGMVLLEAQACGVPVVSSALGGASEALRDGQTGFAFRERDSRALAHRLGQILTDDALASSMSQAARTFAVDRFDIRTCTAALEDYYDHVANAAEEAPPVPGYDSQGRGARRA